MSDWQPIETAPKDGTAVLVCQALDAGGEPIIGEDFGIFIQVAMWWGDAEGEQDEDGEQAAGGEWVVYCNLSQEPRLHFDPTHWMPLPEPPVRPAQREKPSPKSKS